MAYYKTGQFRIIFWDDFFKIEILLVYAVDMDAKIDRRDLYGFFFEQIRDCLVVIDAFSETKGIA